jgi:hypothetical protein
VFPAIDGLRGWDVPVGVFKNFTHFSILKKQKDVSLAVTLEFKLKWILRHVPYLLV